jgi:hypothetical protein
MSSIKFVWSGERESNPRHLPWEGSILPLNYPRGVLELYQKETVDEVMLI